jgi:hypothetical protein
MMCAPYVPPRRGHLDATSFNIYLLMVVNPNRNLNLVRIGPFAENFVKVGEEEPSMNRNKNEW